MVGLCQGEQSKTDALSLFFMSLRRKDESKQLGTSTAKGEIQVPEILVTGWIDLMILEGLNASKFVIPEILKRVVCSHVCKLYRTTLFMGDKLKAYHPVATRRFHRCI